MLASVIRGVNGEPRYVGSKDSHLYIYIYIYIICCKQFAECCVIEYLKETLFRSISCAVKFRMSKEREGEIQRLCKIIILT